MSDLPPGYGPAATNPPEARFECECGASFRWEPEWYVCELCDMTICEECCVSCDGCGERMCKDHTTTEDDLTLCRTCGEDLKG